MIKITAEEKAVLIQALDEQIRNPRRTFLNIEAAFVKDRLSVAGHRELATKLWYHVTMGSTYLIDDEDVAYRLKVLTELDYQTTHYAENNEWITKGT